MKANVLNQLIKNLEMEFNRSSHYRPNSQGIVLTISREYGSSVKKVAQLLVDRLNKEEIGFDLCPKKWLLIDTSVIRDLSEELHLEYKDIAEYVPQEKKGLIEQLIHSFSPSYNKLDGKLDSTLKSIIHAYFERGNVIILGRGGGFYAEGLSNALRIKVNSNYQFRIAKIMENHNLGFQDAKLKMLKYSKLRNDFLEHIGKGKRESYDTVIDRTRLDDSTLADYLLSFTNAKVKDLRREKEKEQKQKVSV
ncbi:cytidylate kinase family protein [Flammeovirga sp. SubArs3]|uniref:cytidylate kinase-like family protein n=1 Tax=Flammeovirga sp. SubArs3 TaxID=2995316 RepID=UPI00248CAD53|nr:cytidylate kinase family protein [Flammeovirga sp. SubArs3]